MSDPVLTQAEGGAEIARSPEDAALLGSAVLDTAGHDASARSERRRAMFDTAGDKLGTFVEGVVDALSMGLIRETGDQASLRRDVNSGSAMFGNAVGFAGGMMLGKGPVSAITKAAEGAGKRAAKTVLRSGEKSLVSRGLQEASASAALAGGQAFGHQLMDSIIEDKEFSSEAILDEVKLAGVMGAVGGVAMGGLGKLVSRQGDIAAQGGLVGSLDEAIKPHREAVRAYDEVVTRHATEVGVIRQLHKDGLVPWEAVEPRIQALNRAARARDALDKINETTALSGTNDAAYKKWQKAGVQHRAAVRELDEVMGSGITMPKDKGLEALDDLIARTPVMSDTPSALRFADTPPPGPVSKLGKAGNAGRYSGGKLADDLPVATQAGQPDFGIPTREQGMSNLAPPAPSQPDFGIPTRERGISELAPPSPDYAPVAADLTNPGRPEVASELGAPSTNITRRADMSTRELPSDPEMAGTRRAVMNANDLPDIYHPGGTHAGQPADPTKLGKSPSPDVTDSVDIPMTSAFDLPPAKVRPLDAAEARVQAAMAELVEKAGGRLDSAGALGILDNAGIRSAPDNVGAYMDQVYAMRKAARLATKPTGPLKDAMGNAVAAGVGATIGGPLGAIVGMAANKMYLGRAGRIAAASGRLMQKVAGSAEKLLTSKRIRAVSAAVANKPHEYSERGPIEDPVERIQEIQFLAANPQAVMERVANAAKDLADEPQMLQALQQRAVNQVQRLAVRAPAIYFDKLGRALSPPAGRMRDFIEYENATHDLSSILDAIGRGTVSKAQSDSLRDNWTSVSVKMASALLQDPEKLKGASRETLRVVEMVTGFPLTNASDPMFLARQGAAWQPVEPPGQGQKPQAFNINPDGKPTPSQSNATGRAPGN